MTVNAPTQPSTSTTKTTAVSSSSSSSSSSNVKITPLSIHSPPPSPSPPAISKVTVSATVPPPLPRYLPAVGTMVFSASTMPRAPTPPPAPESSTGAMVHDMITDLVEPTGVEWDMSALMLLQVAAEDFLNGFTEAKREFSVWGSLLVLLGAWLVGWLLIWIVLILGLWVRPRGGEVGTIAEDFEDFVRDLESSRGM